MSCFRGGTLVLVALFSASVCAWTDSQVDKGLGFGLPGSDGFGLQAGESLSPQAGESLSPQAGEELGLQKESGVVMFWNLENFFDYIDSGAGESDAQFSSMGQRRWTKRRFYTKCDAVGKTILWIADNYGGLPDVIGFAEVENGFVVRSVVSSDVLKKNGYRMVHYDSPDSRGIDVALIYRDSVYELLRSKPCHVYDAAGQIIRTRDILVVTLRRRADGTITHFLVNHHPSKYGGEEASRPRRAAAMTRLKEICDSLAQREPQRGGKAGEEDGSPSGWPASAAWKSGLAGAEEDSPEGGLGQAGEARMRGQISEPQRDGQAADIVAMGDFNDTPDNPLFGIFGDTMVNLALEPFRKREGTIRYAGKWELIDMFIVSPERVATHEMKTVQVPFLMTRDNTHVGDKPLRTYVGPRYAGGVSDHLPILLLPRK